MKNNLNELNEVLFETLRDVKADKVDPKKAQTITNVANSIISNAKVQLSAYKLTNGVAYKDTFGKLPLGQKSKSKDKHTLMNDFALLKGYKSVTDGMAKLGQNEFKIQFNKWQKSA